MYNFNGTCYPKLAQLPTTAYLVLLRGPFYTPHLRIERSKILLLEAHYFAIMAQLRRLRVQIPMTFTMEFLEAQVNATLSEEDTDGAFLAKIHFYRSEAITPETPVSPISFAIEILATRPLAELIAGGKKLELYKDYFTAVDLSSSLQGAYQRYQDWAKIFAYENGYDDCLLLNTQKDIVASAHGSFYLIKDNTVLTPSLSSGATDDVLRGTFNEWLRTQNSFGFEETNLSPFELQKGTEAFAISLDQGLALFQTYRKTHYSDAIVRQLYTRFLESLV
ncbi:MAG: aminotransferase class IV [Flavobacteriaceae bacterium]